MKKRRGDTIITHIHITSRTAALFLALALVLLPVAALASLSVGEEATPSGEGITVATDRQRPHEIIVRFNTSPERNASVLLMNQERMLEKLSSVKTGKKAAIAGDMDRYGVTGLNLIRLPEEVNIDDAVAAARADPSVRYAVPNIRKVPEKRPDDPDFSYQWALLNTGQDVYGISGSARADIHATEAWDVTTGSDKVTIAVLDPSGVEYTHPDLVSNTWRNSREVPNNGRDDDNNGYIDDTVGWDFYDSNDDGSIDAGEGDNDPSPDFLFDDHGTNCAGIMAATGNNGKDTTGVMWSAAMMPLKFDGFTWSEVEGILYARMMGAKVICCSFGNENYGESSYDPPEADVMADSPGVLFVCSAGNKGVDTDTNEHYPSGYGYPNIISVTATNQKDGLPSYSNYGAETVHLAAPGDNILCIDPDGTTSLGDGSSLAVPHVAGVAGLVLTLKPSASVAEIRNAILSGIDKVPALEGRSVTGGRLNALKTVRLIKPDTTPTKTPTTTKTRTRTPVVTKTPTPTKTVVPTKTRVPTLTPTPKKTSTPTKTKTAAPTKTVTPTPGTLHIPVTRTVTVPSPAQETWNTYDSRYFRISYPESALVEPDPMDRDDKVTLTDTGKEYFITIKVSKSTQYSGLSTDDLRDIDIRANQENGMLFMGSRTGTLGGERAAVTMYAMTISGLDFVGTDYIAIHNGRLVMVMVYASERKYDKSKDTTDRITGSLTFI